MKAFAALLSVVAVLSLSCERKSAGTGQTAPTTSNQVNSPRIAKVKVTQTGIISLNGQTVSVDKLKQEFARLKAEEGEVWYYRENPQGEPPEQAMKVMQAVVEAGLPIRLCESESEFNQPQ